MGFFTGAVTSAFVTAWVGAYAAVATGSTNPFVAVAELTGSAALLIVLLIAIVVQTTSANAWRSPAHRALRAWGTDLARGVEV